ncbi:hypothetical protein [Oligoflexus tunisiensis]|uniref:hypothetical protein n=1 Tax=Oligoflexus tunisiensis TaxID=708132 RepID=UPI00114CC396|nr:hypothetical protein [Oligoflexus tunisiensis]
MAKAKQRPGQPQAQADDREESARPSDQATSDDSSTDEIAASMNTASSDEAIGQGRKVSTAGEDLPASELRADIASSRRGIDDEISLRDELKPKDGSTIVTADAGESDEENEMPTGLPKKQGFEDYNPAARPHTGGPGPDVTAQP